MNLAELATRHQTDKGSPDGHLYAPHYERHLSHLRDLPIKLLEIGVGGYENPLLGGESLRMWKDYFPNALIYGLDIVDKRAHDEERIRTIRGDQGDEAFLRRMSHDLGPFDVVIDDGSHIGSHVMTSFRTLFPLLQPNGIYTIEDLQTSYWPNGTYEVDWEGYDGDPFDHNAISTMNFLKALADGLNHAERFQYKPHYLDLNICAITFYHNLCFVNKGRNEAPRYILWVDGRSSLPTAR